MNIEDLVHVLAEKTGKTIEHIMKMSVNEAMNLFATIVGQETKESSLVIGESLKSAQEQLK